MSNHYIVTVVSTHEIEVEANEESEAYFVAVYDTVWDRLNRVGCNVNVSLDKRYDPSYYSDIVGHKG